MATTVSSTRSLFANGPKGNEVSSLAPLFLTYTVPVAHTYIAWSAKKALVKRGNLPVLVEMKIRSDKQFCERERCEFTQEEC